MKLPLLKLCFFASFTYCFSPSFDNILCDRVTEISGPFPSDSPRYFPAKWNETLNAPTYASNQKCRWIVYIPSKHYIFFTMKASIGGGSILKITDTNGKPEKVMTSDQQPYVFVGANFTIDLTVGANGNETSFGFCVEWVEYPAANYTYYDVSRNSSALVFDEFLTDNAQTITAETNVSIIAFPSFWPDATPLLRLSLVFDGPNITSPYLGTLFQAVHLPKPIQSTSGQLTVYTFQEDYFIGPVFIAQDYSNVANLNEIRGITCMSNSSCPVTLYASNGPAAAMTLNVDDGDEFIKKLDLSPDAVLKVYLGARKENDDSNLVVTYNLEQSLTSIPQKFNGVIMTYYLEQGTALVELAEDSNYTRWNDAVVGREGFITSTNFGFKDVYQDTYEYITGLELNQTFAFTVNVTYVDISNGSSLTISFGKFNDQSTVYSYSNENPMQVELLTEIATNMTVDYITNGTVESSGFYLNFKIGSPLQSGSYGNKIFVSFIILLIASL